MQEWWSTLDILMKVTWCIALASSTIFLIQTILSFMGADSGSDFSADFDGDLSEVNTPFQLFSLRNLINFLLGFSWTIIAFESTIKNSFLLVLVAFVVGIFLSMVVIIMFSAMNKLQQSGNIYIESAVGCTGTVYLTIPKQRFGTGKVQISIQGAVREYSAQTDVDIELKNGTPIKVISIISATTVIVEPV